jgi:DNA-binding PadR family transcriptional regulator
MKVSHAELMMVLRSLEREGLIVSNLDSDGQVRWRITEKGKRTRPSDTADHFYLDS